MKAVRFHEHGDPDVLRYEDAPDPPARVNRVVVRVRACALNRLDLFQRRGLDRVRIPLPHISGADIAGEIVSAGAQVSAWRAGDRVMLQPGLSCGVCAECLGGRDNRCASYDVFGYQCDGGYAELVSAPVQNLIRLPDAIDFTTAAAFPLVFLTAWHMLVTEGQLTEQQTVLVLAAGSGVGQAAVQIAHAIGARVIATTGGEAKAARARSLGADEVIDHYSGDVLGRVKELTGGRGVNLVIEHVGKATWDRSVRCLARGGRLVTCGATTGHEAALDLRHLFARQLSIVGSYMGAKGELLRVAEWFFRGRVRPVIDRTFPLSEAAQAHRYLESSVHFGKVVLVM